MTLLQPFKKTKVVSIGMRTKVTALPHLFGSGHLFLAHFVFGHIAFGHVVALGSRFDDAWYEQQHAFAIRRGYDHTAPKRLAR
jgi:hypothetical protein